MPTGTSNSPLKQTGMQYSTSGTGKGYVDPRYQSPASGVQPKYDMATTQQAGAAIESVGQIGSSLISASNTDPLSGNYKSKATTAGAVSGAASGASMGAVLGPWGMLAGAAIGGIYGGVTSSQQADEDIKGARTTKTLQEMEKVRLQESGLTMTGKTKVLTSIQGTTPYNKSANEHKSGLTMNKIAMSGISSKY
jgi:gas vesicle protein